MKNADKPAMPVHDVIESCSADGNQGPYLFTKVDTCLTKREMFAMAAMQGILSSLTDDCDMSPSELARCAVRNADALLKELENN